jgi:enamine deaminase RidA (YjgF/YER057c/UK114 family)
MASAITPASLAPPFARYSHGVTVEAGQRLVFVSGQLGIAPDLSVPESVEAQAELCFQSIGTILAAAGLDFGHVVKLTAYVTDRAHMPGYMTVRDRYAREPLPASTLLIVSGFTRAEFKVEVEAIAAGPA